MVIISEKADLHSLKILRASDYSKFEKKGLNLVKSDKNDYKIWTIQL